MTGTGPSDTKYLWSGWKLAAELAADGTTVNRTFVWGAGSLLAQIDNGAVTYAVPDTHGSIVGYLNGSGAFDAAVEYSPYGRVINSTGSVTSHPIGYSGQYTDWETGLVYYGLRYYQPKHGRFINRDPIEEQGGLNLYGFCGNDPVNCIDILGCDPFPAGMPQWARDIVILTEVSMHGRSGCEQEKWYNEWLPESGWYSTPHFEGWVGGIYYQVVGNVAMWSDKTGDNTLTMGNDGTFYHSVAGGNAVSSIDPNAILTINGTSYFTIKKGDTYYTVLEDEAPNNVVAKSPATYTDENGTVYTYSDGGHVIYRGWYSGANAKDRAAVSLIRAINPSSIKEGLEYASVLQTNGKGAVNATVPLNVGLPGNSVFRFEDIGSGNTLGGLVHTHGSLTNATDNFFSSVDLAVAGENKVSSYVGTPDGNIYRYDPSGGSFYRYDSGGDKFVPQPVYYDQQNQMYRPRP